MTKEQMLKDYLVSRCISQGKTVEGYKPLYYRTNEDLIDAYLDVDFKDKDVLSVLASGDHVFTSDFLDAKKTDTFDYNPLTIYYYYLRIWSILYKDELYPRIVDDEGKYLKELLDMVLPRNDQEIIVYNFFKQHALLGTNLTPLFCDMDKQIEGKTMFTKADDLVECLNRKPVFYNKNVFNRMNLNKTYDIALISNIPDLAYGNKEKLIQLRDNLKRLVRPGGHVICSQLRYKPKENMDLELEIFSKDFEYDQKKSSYVYTKKNK